MLKVLHIVPHLDRSGGAIAALSLHQGLQSIGVESEILGVYEAESKTRKLTPIRAQPLLRTIGNRVLAPIERQLALPGVLRFTDWLGFDDRILQGVDIVHLHVTHVAQLSLGLLRGLGTRRKIVWTLHDLWPVTGNCIYPLGCEKWKSACGACPQLGVYPRLRWDTTRVLHSIKTNLLRHLRPHFIAPSRWVEKELADIIKSGYGTVSHVQHGIDTTIFRCVTSVDDRASLGVPEDTRVIFLPTARLDDPRKGAADLDRLIGELAWSPHKYMILMFSAVTSTHADHLPNVSLRRLRPVTTNEAMARYYRAADVTLSFSRVETFGLSLAESQACGRAVVAVEAPGVNELIDNPLMGTMVKANEIGKMIAYIGNFSSEEYKVKEQRATVAARRYSLIRSAQLHSQVYDRIISRARAASPIHASS